MVIAQIMLNNITKIFKIAERPKGRFNMLKGAFLRKTKEIHAIDNISFNINEGELVGYIGPNGAGKSTSVKVIDSRNVSGDGFMRLNHPALKVQGVSGSGFRHLSWKQCEVRQTQTLKRQQVLKGITA